MEVRDYSAVLPDRPPEGTLEWMKGNGAFSKEFAVYGAEYYTDPLTQERVKGVKVTCTACGHSTIEAYVPAGCWHSYAPAPFGFYNSVYKEAVISGGCTICPECMQRLEAKHIGNMPRGIMQEAWCMTVGRFEDKLVLYGWLFRRHIDKDGRSEYWSNPYEAYVVEEKKIVRLMGYQKCLSSVSLFGHWEQRKTYLDNWGLAPRIVPWNPEVLHGTTAENSKLDLYLKAAGDSPFPVSYIRLWQKRPRIENLVMQGAGYLVAELTEKESMRYGYERAKACPKLSNSNGKEKRPAQMLGLNKNEFRHCVSQKWMSADLEVYKTLRAAEPVTLPEDMKLVKKYGASDVASLLRSRLRKKQPVMRCLRYLERQNKLKGPVVNGGYLLDYWGYAAGLGENLADSSIRFPKDLRRQHDRVVEERGRIDAAQREKELAKEIEKRAPQFKARAEQLAPFAWQKDGILIRPAADEQELILEGSVLSHCVARYAQSVASGGTAIFFIRRAEQPDMPWYTLQLNEKSLTVAQNRGKKNCDRTPEISAFEAEWLAWLKEQRAAGKLEKKPARKSVKKKKEAHAA